MKVNDSGAIKSMLKNVLYIIQQRYICKVLICHINNFNIDALGYYHSTVCHLLAYRYYYYYSRPT